MSNGLDAVASAVDSALFLLRLTTFLPRFLSERVPWRRAAASRDADRSARCEEAGGSLALLAGAPDDARALVRRHASRVQVGASGLASLGTTQAADHSIRLPPPVSHSQRLRRYLAASSRLNAGPLATSPRLSTAPRRSVAASLPPERQATAARPLPRMRIIDGVSSAPADAATAVGACSRAGSARRRARRRRR